VAYLFALDVFAERKYADNRQAIPPLPEGCKKCGQINISVGGRA